MEISHTYVDKESFFADSLSAFPSIWKSTETNLKNAIFS